MANEYTSFCQWVKRMISWRRVSYLVNTIVLARTFVLGIALPSSLNRHGSPYAAVPTNSCNSSHGSRSVDLHVFRGKQSDEQSNSLCSHTVKALMRSIKLTKQIWCNHQNQLTWLSNDGLVEYSSSWYLDEWRHDYGYIWAPMQCPVPSLLDWMVTAAGRGYLESKHHGEGPVCMQCRRIKKGKRRCWFTGSRAASYSSSFTWRMPNRSPCLQYSRTKPSRGGSIVTP